MADVVLLFPTEGEGTEEVSRTISDLVADFKKLLDFDEVPYPTDDENDVVLTLEIKSAIGIINRCRRFTPSETLLYDPKYEDKILPLAEASFMKRGAEGEVSHTENGIMRQYGSSGKYPKEMLQDIVPLTKWG